MYKNILVAIDLDDATQNDNLMRVASDIAGVAGSEVSILTIAAAPPPDVSQFLPERYERTAFDKITKQLETVAANSELKGRIKDVSVRFGNVYQEILAYAQKAGIDLIIVASHRPHVSDYLLGTTAARIVRYASCSTLVVRQSGGPSND